MRRFQALRRLLFTGLAALLLPAANPADAAAPQIAKDGYGSTLALTEDGRVLAFGDDTYGQLGLGRILQSASPVRIAGLERVREVSISPQTILALTEDGQLWGWGNGVFGILLDGGQTDRSRPLRMPISDVKSVSVGFTGVLAVKNDGTVWQWGYLPSAPGTTGGVYPTPTRVEGLTDVVAVAFRPETSYALRRDGTVWVWGRSVFAGVGSRCLSQVQECMLATPRPVPGLSGIVAISSEFAFTDFTLALRADGSLWGWGDNPDGLLGDDPANQVFLPYASPGGRMVQLVPRRVEGLADVAAFSADSMLGLAVTRDGRLWSWGDSRYGLLARDVAGGTWAPPAPVTGARDMTAAGASNSFGVALDASGNAWSWGYNSSGQLGLGLAAAGLIPQPQRIGGLPALRSIRSVQGLVAVVGRDGSVWAWGENGKGQLGLGQPNRNTATPVPGLPAIKAIAAVSDSLALDQAGAVWAWGARFGAKPIPLPGLPPAKAIASGVVALALAEDGAVWGHGNSRTGVFGPVGDVQGWGRIPGGNDVKAIAAGDSHVLMVKSDGSVLAIGGNHRGELGAADDGRCSYTFFSGHLERCSNVPLRIEGLPKVAAVYASGHTSFALAEDGGLWGWGDNQSGNVGVAGGNCSWRNFDGSSFPCFNTPQRLAIPAVVRSMYDDRAVTAEGQVWTWGRFEIGDSDTPRREPALSSVVTLASARTGGGRTTTFMRSDKSLWSIGSNRAGQAGDGTYAQAFAPVQVVNEGATEAVSLAPGGPAVSDPLEVLRKTIALDGLLQLSLSDPRASQVSGQVFFSVLAPANSELVVGAGTPTGPKPAPSGSAQTRRRTLAAGRTLADAGPKAAASAGAVVAGVLARGGFKQTGGQSFVQAEASYSGLLSAAAALTVYDLTRNPLQDSNVLICMGVTTGELSAKGQVLMRPIATGTAIQGVAQCPPVQTAATIERFRAEASGPVGSRTLSAVIDPLPEDRGRSVQLFSWAVAPDGRQFMQTGANRWEAMAEPMVPVATLAMPAAGQLRHRVTDKLDLRGLEGTLVFIGYGQSWEEVRRLNRAGHYYTVD